MIDMTDLIPSDLALPHRLPPVGGHAFTRAQLALFAGGSGDHNPIHIDSDIAKAKGFEDVIVPGMLLMAQVGKMLADWAGPSTIRRWNVRFTNITPILATPTYFAEILERTEVAGERCLRLAVWVEVPEVGEVVRGEAVVAERGEAGER
ncbi:MaoC/PaaZ C-terminal domain-containing protein [Flavisphingomonas formosensis]|uniref:MaoC/PaaZ C-terminal domain-containing protein n=1 Tax=Flavisphingomonas formosensis TaxID=861534 RepID=UPI0018E04ED9|nr:MaoC/PaaZ C-terminal domain-containing protein [Sphingomonas formosensis]